MTAVIYRGVILLKELIRENYFIFKLLVIRIKSAVDYADVDIAEIFIIVPCFVDIGCLDPPV